MVNRVKVLMYPRKREHFSEVTFCSKILDPLHKFTEFQLHMRKQREIEWPSAVERSLHFWNQKQRLFFFSASIYIFERERGDREENRGRVRKR